MKLEEDLITGEKEANEFLNNATFCGLNIIKLVWSKSGINPKNVTGFDIPKFKSGQSGHTINSGNYTIVSGMVIFNPDKYNRLWGYIIDTPRNRDILAGSFTTSWYRIADQRVLGEILELAKKKGLTTEKIEVEDIAIKKTIREIKAEEEARQAINDKAKLEKQLAEMQQKLDSINSAQNSKPVEARKLEGVKLQPK